jgi:diamine N-acetyltransferase
MLIGKKVRLRALEREDIPNFVRWFNDREVTEYLGVYPMLSKAMEEKWFENQLSIPQNKEQTLSIDALDGDQWIHIGDASLMNIESVSNHAEFGIAIGEKSFWNKGYGREATFLMVKHGFEDLNLNRIYLRVFEEHVHAIATYQSAGFVQEGVMREVIYKDGSYHNMLLMSILHSDWKGN